MINSDDHSFPYLAAGQGRTRYHLEDPTSYTMRGYRVRGDEELEAHARTLMQSSIIISLHDHPQVLPIDYSDQFSYFRDAREWTPYENLRSGGLTAVFDSLGGVASSPPLDGEWGTVIRALGLRLADLSHQRAAVHVTTLSGLRHAKEADVVGIIFGAEDSGFIGVDVDRLDVVYGLGVRHLGMTSSSSNNLGSGLGESTDGGLTRFGRRAVERMNQLGIAIDISHSGDITGRDVIEASDGPVFITHAGARAVWDTQRMKPDDILLACAARGGVLGIQAAPMTTLSRSHDGHPFEAVMEHFMYAVELMGIDHVAFGPDSWYGDPLSKLGCAEGFETPTCWPTNVVTWMLLRGFSDAEVSAVMGGNILRVLRDVWKEPKVR